VERIRSRLGAGALVDRIDRRFRVGAIIAQKEERKS